MYQCVGNLYVIDQFQMISQPTHAAPAVKPSLYILRLFLFKRSVHILNLNLNRKHTCYPVD